MSGSNPRAVMLLLVAWLLPASLFAQSGTVYDDLSLASELLGSDRKYAIYLPPDYDTSSRSYPVLYLLHGAGDDQTGWVQFGEVQRIADQAIRDGSAAPMVIVMPDANTGQRGYFNTISGTWRYEDFFFDELIPHIEATYRVRGEKEFRAVAGLSMGGGGSLMYALHRPDMFASAAPLSAYQGPLDTEELRGRLGNTNATDAEVESYFRRHSAISLVEDMLDDQRDAVRWYIDCGDDDFLFEGNSLLHIAMRQRGIPHEFRIRDGGHSWTYWRDALPAVLEFVSVTFHR